MITDMMYLLVTILCLSTRFVQGHRNEYTLDALRTVLDSEDGLSEYTLLESMHNAYTDSMQPSRLQQLGEGERRLTQQSVSATCRRDYNTVILDRLRLEPYAWACMLPTFVL